MMRINIIKTKKTWNCLRNLLLAVRKKMTKMDWINSLAQLYMISGNSRGTIGKDAIKPRQGLSLSIELYTNQDFL